MRNESPECAHEVGNLGICTQQQPCTVFKNLILIFFPGKKIGCKCNEKKNCKENANRTRNLMCTFVFKQFCYLYGFFFFRFKRICSFGIFFYGFNFFRHGNKDNKKRCFAPAKLFEGKLWKFISKFFVKKHA